jgi:outer membrane lipoprotein-sorting protein
MARIARARIGLAAVAALVLALGVGLTAGHAQGSPTLPSVGAEELVASSLRALAERTPVSGTVTTHLDLGLPQLPAGLGGQTGLAEALLSDQTFKEWRSQDGVRVAQILPFSERVLVANATDLWAWDSDRSTAWHLAVPATAAPPQPPSMGDLEGIVAEVLDAAAPCADVSADRTAWVAGRASYVLALVPTSSGTLVGRIEVAIDAETRVPLRLQVFAKGSLDPAVDVGFTSVDFGPVDPAMFAFSPPEGATVKEVTVPDREGAGPSAPGDFPEVRVFGEGFGLILAVRVPTDQVPSDVRALFPFSGPLASADLMPRGDHAWIVAGAVSPEALAAVEPKLP